MCTSEGESKRCGLVFPSKNKVNAHRAQSKHLQRKRKSGSSSKIAASEPKQLRLDEQLRLAQKEDQAADSGTEEDKEICNLYKVLFVCIS